MIEPTHSINTLFEQLGLPAESDQIEAFISSHQLQDGTLLHEAPFWTPSQSSFLREGLTADADWAEVIDELDARLRA
ncbi:DUF2789 domain-containing protein [Motiliproteus sp. MSK22-1]|uniref:DUF2789 domain-containing protein n=1 Tax=Motiliproteus sp. MSK22-1 TaxID=1897630 RepID=UPI000975FB01|nr:DUF2789 domain-containing protein [Motiliproteus sp. MSK22-1]OMH31654.1 hypothetical protein BGP75_16110 [Motiliproteus sp. MSK22-1]